MEATMEETLEVTPEVTPEETPEVTPEETPEVTPETTEEAKPAEQPEHYGKKVEKRFSKLTSTIKSQENEIDSLNGRIAELETMNVDVTIKPVKSDFDDDDDYYEELTEWKVNQKFAETNRRERETLSTRKEGIKGELTDNNKKEFFERVAIAKDRIPDIEQKLSAVTATPHMVDTMFSMDLGPEVAYHLATHPDLAGKISDMNKTQASVALGRLEATLESQYTKKTTSGTPPPITPIEGDDVPVKDPSKMTTVEWMAHEEKRERAKIAKNLGLQ